MKKITLLLITLLITTSVFSQHFHYRNVYKNIDTLLVETVASVYPTQNNEYLIEIPSGNKLVIAYNEDKTKAIVLQSSFPFVRYKEYNVKEDERRIILWYDDNILYCGYVYDKKLNAAQYCETINKEEFKNLLKEMPFLIKLPFDRKRFNLIKRNFREF